MTRMMIYHGTKLYERILGEGRLSGNPIRYGYEIEDETADRFGQIFTRIRGEALWNYSLAYRTHDVFLAMALARRLFPDGEHSGTAERLESLRSKVNALYVSTYREALELARSGGGYREAGPLVGGTRRISALIERDLAEIEAALSAVLRRPVRRFSPISHAAAAVFTFALLGSPSACSHVGAQTLDSGTGDSDTDSDSDSDSDTDTDTDTECTQNDIDNEMEDLATEVNNEVPCFAGNIFLDNQSVHAALQSTWPDVFIPCEDTTAATQLTDLAEQAVDPSDYLCLDQQVTEVDGGYSDQIDTMADEIEEECNAIIESGDIYVIEFDSSGIVVAVTPQNQDPHSLEVAACVMTALEGLEFPCLADFEICPEYMIAE